MKAFCIGLQWLMRKMGIAALGPKPRTTKPAPGHKMFPYLLRLGNAAAFGLLVATKPVDFRRGADSLVALVRDQLKHDPFSARSSSSARSGRTASKS